MIPFEFIVQGPPVSLQTRNRARLRAWKGNVRAAAQLSWPVGEPPSAGQLKITITYFFDQASPDVDNIIKPIQDALKGLVYVDDNQIFDATSKKRDVNNPYIVRRMSPVLAQGFVTGADFLYIKVELATNFQDLN